ncbi:hypothetical protein AeMF1_000382 [Aphanomyces euteiches]|nr:hypothetical protein AeMF1_000382 [Aphanomyces euteiches]
MACFRSKVVRVQDNYCRLFSTESKKTLKSEQPDEGVPRSDHLGDKHQVATPFQSCEIYPLDEQFHISDAAVHFPLWPRWQYRKSKSSLCQKTLKPKTANPIISSPKESKKKDAMISSKPLPLKTQSRSTSGFIRGAIQAYNHHHNLEIRPDDVWLAIMVQFGLYVNGNAEKLRSALAKHEGQKELAVVDNATLQSADYGKLATRMVYAMEEHLVDPALSEWILPSFSTTTDNDKIVGSVVMMATMKKYFSFRFKNACGLPNVTLLGTVEDWEDIRARVDKLADFGEDLIEWTCMLSGILDEFVLSAKGTVNVEFWKRICHHVGEGSGTTYVCGWISVFALFNQDGQWQGRKRTYTKWHIEYLDDKPDSGNFGRRCRVQSEEVTTDYPLVDMSDIPAGYLTVDVVIDDNGTEHKALMFAGHMAYQVHDQVTIAPHLSWAITLKNGVPLTDEEELAELFPRRRSEQKSDLAA